MSVVANATMDEIRFHWDRLFGKLNKSGTKLNNWMNPSISWVNKYKFKSSILKYLFSTVLVWCTDFWHFLKAIHLLSIFSIIILLIDPTIELKWFIPALLLFSLGWGFIFESTFGIYGVISSKIKNNK